MENQFAEQRKIIRQSLSRAQIDKPAYGELYPLLGELFLLQLAVKSELALTPQQLTAEAVKSKWQSGVPLLRRWDFPVDAKAAARMLAGMTPHIPDNNQTLCQAHAVLQRALTEQPNQAAALWQSFLHHDWEPWEEWVDTRSVDMASLMFWARSAVRPSLEWTAEDLAARFAVPDQWLHGYCPLCGSLPALLFLQGAGERHAYCSWCGHQWSLYRLQCPYCDNRHHESLGYLYVEAEPHYRIHYCRLCKMYFKAIDTRERLQPVFYPLEEWTTLHLDLLAQRAGWHQPPSPSPAVYGENALPANSAEPSQQQ